LPRGLQQAWAPGPGSDGQRERVGGRHEHCGDDGRPELRERKFRKEALEVFHGGTASLAAFGANGALPDRKLYGHRTSPRDAAAQEPSGGAQSALGVRRVSAILRGAMTSEPPSIRNVHDVDEPRLHALVELMFLGATADGEFSGEERKHFQESVESLTDRKITGEMLDKLLDAIEKSHAGEGRASRIAHVRAALPTAELRVIGLTMAIRVMCADGIVRTTERELILDLADGLEIDRDQTADLVAQISAGG
jgi:uncharacterized tellurite resistance protein B-like protein